MKSLYLMSFFCLVAHISLAQTIFYEDFSSASQSPPDNWTVNLISGIAGQDEFHYDNPYVIDSLNSRSSDPFATFSGFYYSDDGTDEEVELLSPVFSCPESEELNLEFYEYFFTSGEGTGLVNVSLSIDGGITWELIHQLDSGESAQIPVKVSIDISKQSSGQSDVRLKFHAVSQGNIIWILDDISVVSGEITPPQITELSSLNSCESGPFKIQAAVTDESGIHRSSVRYRINGSQLDEIEMKEEKEGVYEVEISTIKSFGLLEYQLIAEDNSVNKNIAINTGDIRIFDTLWLGSYSSEDYRLEFSEQDKYKYFIESSHSINWDLYSPPEQVDSSLYLNLYDITDKFQDYTVRTAPVNLAETHNLLVFDYAYAPYRDNFDTLEIFISVDHGETWEGPVYSKSGDVLATAASSDRPFFPDENEWETDSINLSSFIGECIVIAFIAKSGDGNNLFLDDLRFVPGKVLDRSIKMSQNYPNPTSGKTKIDIEISNGQRAQLAVINTSGQTVKKLEIFNKRNFTIELDVTDLRNGIYLYRLETDQDQITKPLIKFD